MLSKKVGLGLKVWHFVLLFLLFVIWFMYYWNQKTVASISNDLKEMENDKIELEIEYEVNETKDCLDKTKEILSKEAKVRREIAKLQKELYEMRQEKNLVCDALREMPLRAESPYEYYEVSVDDDWNVTVK